MCQINTYVYKILDNSAIPFSYLMLPLPSLFTDVIISNFALLNKH